MRILWIPHAAWQIQQRAQLFTKALAERHEVHVTVFGDYRRIQDYFSVDYLQNFFYSQRKEGKLKLHRLPRISPALYFPLIRQWNNQVFQKTVEEIIEQQKIDVMVGTYVCPPPRNAPRLVFDLYDENVSQWRADGYPQIANEIAANEKAYFEKANVVVAASSVLWDKAKATGTKAQIVHIPNGIELADYAIPAPSKANAKKRIGAVANFDNIAEMELILEAVTLLQTEALQFYLAGRGQALEYAAREAQRRGLAHLEIAGAVARENLAQVLNSFDVALCIYKQSPMDAARSPMRLMAYAALGLPTVATELEEIRRMQFPNVLRVAASPRAIVAGIRQALVMPRMIPKNIADYSLVELVKRYEAVLEATL